MVNLIAKSNKTNKNNKKYIIDTLIDLTKLNLESIGKKYFEGKNDNLIIGIKREELFNDNISKIDDEKLNTINSSIKELKYNNLFSSINLIENEDIIPNKKYDSEEIYVKNNILLELKEENICNNNDKIIHKQNYNNNYKYIDNQTSIKHTNNIFAKNIKLNFS